MWIIMSNANISWYYTYDQILEKHIFMFFSMYGSDDTLSAIWFFKVKYLTSWVIYFNIIADSHEFFYFLKTVCIRPPEGNHRKQWRLSKRTQNHQTIDTINSKKNLCGKEPRGGILCMACEIYWCLTSISWLLRGAGWGETGKYITGCFSCNCLSQCLTHCGCSNAVVVKKIATVQQTYSIDKTSSLYSSCI